MLAVFTSAIARRRAMSHVFATLARREQEPGDRRGQDKARKVRAVGRDGEHREIPAIRQTLRSSKRTFRVSATRS